MSKTKTNQLTVRLEAIIEQLHKAVAPIGAKARDVTIYEQIIALRGIVCDLKGGGSNG